MLVAGHPGHGNSSAAALLSYDAPHRIPWDWKVSLYTLTKSIAAGVMLAAAFVPAGLGDHLWQWGVPLLGLAFLALTGLLLIADLEHPKRFYLIFTRPQWKSWLVRGAFVIAAYGAFLTLHLASSLFGATLARGWITAGVLTGGATAVYTAWLFAQAKARDLWQSPLLPPHLLVQALVAGSATLLLWATAWAPEASGRLAVVLAVSSALHLVLVATELTLPHSTAHVSLAVREMTRGRYRRWFRAGLALGALGLVSPWVEPSWLMAVPACGALVGLGLYEHAYVQGGQAVPLA